MNQSVSGQRVVITGAGGGIGRAFAQAFAAAGARVVINDIDPDTCAASATELGVIGIAGDAASVDGVARLIGSAREELGGIDIYCANAGVEGGHGLNSTESQWANAFEVNVMAHVRAAQQLVPEWLERGSGRFIVTASAAGLLTMIGSAPYAVSKHAAVAFAEWMELTYRHRGINTQVVCPQWVETPMLDGARSVGAHIDPNIVLTPEFVAECLMQAISEEQFLVLPHPEVADYYRARAGDTQGWLGQMNRLQQKLTPPK
ncbi:MAG: SDR family NAD(P)-dependent oxidoreductase [Candidatus Nanopelagicales bacterium]